MACGVEKRLFLLLADFEDVLCLDFEADILTVKFLGVFDLRFEMFTFGLGSGDLVTLFGDVIGVFGLIADLLVLLPLPVESKDLLLGLRLVEASPAPDISMISEKPLFLDDLVEFGADLDRLELDFSDTKDSEALFIEFRFDFSLKYGVLEPIALIVERVCLLCGVPNVVLDTESYNEDWSLETKSTME